MVWMELVREALQTHIDCGVFAAFNANIDVVVQVTPAQLKKIFVHEPACFVDPPLEPRRLWSVETSTHFLALLQECMVEGKSYYGVMDMKLAKWLDANFCAKNEAMGGQAGIIANQMAALGAKSHVYNPVLSAKQARVYHHQVMFPIITNGLRWVPIDKGVNDSWTKVNYIFEYPKETRYVFGSQEIVTPRANRIILGTRNHKAAMGFDKEMEAYLPELGQRFQVGFMAGYHHGRIAGRADTLASYIALSLKQLCSLREKNPELQLHLEYVPMQDSAEEVTLLEALIPEFTSFGINENEILRLLVELGNNALASEIKTNERAFSLYEGTLALFRHFKISRIQLHNLGYYILILAKPYPVLPALVRQACLFASAVNGIKAKKGGVVFADDLVEMRDYPLSQIGLRQLVSFAEEARTQGLPIPSDFTESGIMETSDHYLVLVPAHVVPNPVSTVGMGDTISSSSFVAEISLGRLNSI